MRRLVTYILRAGIAPDGSRSRDVPRRRRVRVGVACLLAAWSPIDDSDRLRRARLLQVFCALLTLGALVGGVHTYSIGYQSLALSYGAAVLLASTLPVFLRRAGSLELVGNLLAIAVFTPLTVANFQAGGLGGSGIYLLALVPLVALLVSGLRSGFGWVALCVAEIIGIALLHQRGFAFPHPVQREYLVAEQTLGASALVVVTFGLAAAYETLKNQALVELQAAHGRAQEAERAKGEFLANVSHEIRTPMNIIIGMTDIALDGELAAESRDCLRTIRCATLGLLAMVNDILDYSKVEAGKITLQAVPVSMRSLVDEIVELFAPAARERKLVLATDIDPALAEPLRTDPVRWKQVLTNLVANALKFTDTGSVTVEIRGVGRTATHVRLRVAVRDTGIGIPADRQAGIFDSFAQVDNSTTRTNGGTGLGLTICRHLVELIGGDLSVESEVGKGSTFWFETDLAVADAGGAMPDPLTACV